MPPAGPELPPELRPPRRAVALRPVRGRARQRELVHPLVEHPRGQEQEPPPGVVRGASSRSAAARGAAPARGTASARGGAPAARGSAARGATGAGRPAQAKGTAGARGAGAAKGAGSRSGVTAAPGSRPPAGCKLTVVA